MYRFDSHPRRFLRRHLASALVLSIGWVVNAAAQGADGQTQPAASVAISSPKLTTFFEAPYPQEALRSRVEGTVVLELTISNLGTVESVQVVEGPEHGLNEAARDAAFRFVFTPARVAGEARAARIKYAYDFSLPPSEGPDSPETSPGTPATSTTIVPQSTEPSKVADTTKNEGNAIKSEQSESAEAPSDGGTVVVRGYREQDRTRRSANAVTVVDLDRAQRESSDVGEVLARVEGVSVQRVGGLGSRARLSLGGFDDSQVRFFIDGVPLEYAGYSFGIENVPVTSAEHINIYKGVVPVRLGADSLGGAFDLVTDRKTAGTHGMASLQAGSFDTYRMAGSARHLNEKTGFFVKGEGFFDETKSDYLIDVKVSDLTGERRDAQVRRFHDGYQALGGNVELGFVNRKWARRLLARAFVTDYTKEIQHNLLMTVPYGEAQYGGRSNGGSLRYEQYFGQGLSGTFVSGYVFDRTNVLDAAPCVYDWYGQCIVERRNPGEIGALPSDRSLWDHTGYLRWNLEWKLRPDHEIRFATAPTYFTRTGEERHEQSRDALDRLSAQREMLKWVSGVEYQVELFDSRLQNIVFGKSYLQASQGEDVLTSSYTARYSVQKLHWGAGDALRYQFWDWAFGKVSYEYAIRLPEPEELFGKGALVQENLDLLPERSHNANLTFLVNNLETALGKFDGSVTGFYRKADQLIVLLGRDNVFYYDNVFRGRTVGVEGALTWISPGEYVELGGNTTYQDFRNVSDEGTFGQFDGDRIPNKPYLFANGRLRLQARQFASPRDELSLTWYSRYVHEFFKSWESVGSEQLETKPTIDSQLVHTLVLAYLIRSQEGRELSFSAEVQNLTDEKTYDFYGQQRPGRSVFAKTMMVF